MMTRDIGFRFKGKCGEETMKVTLAIVRGAILSAAMVIALGFTGCVFAQTTSTAANAKAAAPATSAATPSSPDWTEPFPPFRIVGNLYYVGSKGLANYLVVTPQGNILINSDTDANVPMIKASIEKLGFKFSDTKILLISHAHWDHDAGSALVKRETGAKYMVMDADVAVVESGGKQDFNYGSQPETLYTPTKVDRVLHDGEEVRLGGAVLVAHLTPGHTKGCTTWTMKVTEGDKTYDVVIVGSPNVNPGYKLVNNAAYPGIAADYAKMFRVLKALPCDFFLGAHGSYYDMEAKYPRLKDGSANPFIDPDGYKKYVAQTEQAFETELAKQKAATASK
jgi:metallo-beta-lactamase class B